MDDKKIAIILMGFLEKYPLNDEERKAIKSAIGILSWASLAESRIKNKKDKLDKSAKWE